MDPGSVAALQRLRFEWLGQHVVGRRGRDREADSLGVLADRVGHSDDLAVQVDERTAGVARVDRRVGLDHAVERSGLGVDLAIQPRDRPLGERLGLVERIADRGHSGARDGVVAGEVEDMSVDRLLEPEYGQVAWQIDPLDAGVQRPVVELDAHARRIVDDMLRRHHQAGPDQERRPGVVAVVAGLDQHLGDAAVHTLVDAGEVTGARGDLTRGHLELLMSRFGSPIRLVPDPGGASRPDRDQTDRTGRHQSPPRASRSTIRRASGPARCPWRRVVDVVEYASGAGGVAADVRAARTASGRAGTQPRATPRATHFSALLRSPAADVPATTTHARARRGHRAGKSWRNIAATPLDTRNLTPTLPTTAQSDAGDGNRELAGSPDPADA